MAKVTAPPARWQALGEELTRRRVELSPSYKARAVFSRATGVNDRMLSDLEGARRSTYRRDSLRAVEGAYQLPEDAIARFVSSTAAELERVHAEQVDADPLTAPTDTWEEELLSPNPLLHDGERLRWRSEEVGRRYRLELAEEDVSVEYTFGPGEEPSDVVEDLRELLEPHLVQVRQLKKRRARR